MEQCDLLLEYLRQQKEKAYELLYHDYYVPLVLFAGKYVENEEVAKDIVQEFFISLLDKEMVFNNRIALKVYLYTGVRNKSLNYLRHLKIRRQYEMKMLEEGEKQEVFRADDGRGCVCTNFNYRETVATAMRESHVVDIKRI